MPSLELGCGYHRDPRCDVFMDANRSIVGLDHYGRAEDPLPWPDGHFDLIVAVDVLEHISYRNTDLALAEWARVLRTGGQMYVQVPAADEIFRMYCRQDPRLAKWEHGTCTLLDGAQWRLLGGHEDGRYVEFGGDFRLNAHFSLWSKESLTAALDRIGFDCIATINAHPNICATATRRVD